MRVKLETEVTPEFSERVAKQPDAIALIRSEREHGARATVGDGRVCSRETTRERARHVASACAAKLREL
jgi:hypothetical protein